MTPGRSSLVRILLWLALAAVLSVLALAAEGQESVLPDAPLPMLSASVPSPFTTGPYPAPAYHAQPRTSRLFWTFLAVDAASRALDVYSTQRSLNRGNREILLPTTVASHPAVMASIEAGDLIGIWWVSRRLTEQGHPKLARWLPLADAAGDLPWALHNLFLPKEKQPDHHAPIYPQPPQGKDPSHKDQ